MGRLQLVLGRVEVAREEADGRDVGRLGDGAPVGRAPVAGGRLVADAHALVEDGAGGQATAATEVRAVQVVDSQNEFSILSGKK